VDVRDKRGHDDAMTSPALFTEKLHRIVGQDAAGDLIGSNDARATTSALVIMI
jgi:hypothetical protein